MSSINVINIICNNPEDMFTSQFKFEIVFECLSELKNDVEWKLIYIGKADDTSYDQELESLLIGPLELGQMSFEFVADCPDPSKIPKEDLLGVTAIILTCSYNNQEFFRVGYYVDNIYEIVQGEEELQIDYTKIKRLILHDKPRITKFNIGWDSCLDNIPTYSSTEDQGMFHEGVNLDEVKNEFNKMK